MAMSLNKQLTTTLVNSPTTDTFGAGTIGQAFSAPLDLNGLLR